MANVCFFEIHVRGNTDDVEKFIDIVSGFSEGTENAKYLPNVYEANVIDTDMKDGKYIVYIEGECEWGVWDCMCDDQSEYSYIKRLPNKLQCTLKSCSADLHLDIEVWGETPDCDAQEHHIYKDGVTVLEKFFEYNPTFEF